MRRIAPPLMANLLLVASCLAAPAWAQTLGPTPAATDNAAPAQRQLSREERQAKWKAMSAEERSAAKAKARQRYEAMTPEQQKKIKDRRAQRGAANAS